MRTCIPIILLLLTACQGGFAPADGQKILSGLDGPKVPTVQDALTETAINAEKNGDFKQAIQLYQQILEKHPDNKNAALALADCYRRSGDSDRALAIYNGLLQQDAGNLAAKEGKGLALMSKGDFTTPTALFEEIMKSDPKRWKTLNALGILFTTRNMQPEAQQYFKEALKNNPENPSILNNIGLSQALDRHNTEAITTLLQAAALAPAGSMQHKRIDLNMALVYAISGNLDEARSIAQNYYSGATLDNNMGLYAHLAKDDQAAKAYLNMALTESTVFYQKAWDNLKDLGGGETATDSPAKPPAEEAPPQPAKKPASKKSGKLAVKTDRTEQPDDGISSIVGATEKKESALPPSTPIEKNSETGSW